MAVRRVISPALVGSHFQHYPLVRIFQPQQSQRQTDEVIEIPLGLESCSGKSQDRGQHLLGRGFAARPGDRRHRPAERSAGGAGQITQGGQGILNPDNRHLEPGTKIFGKAGRSPFSHRFKEKIMAIKILPSQRYEQISGLDATAVHRTTADNPRRTFALVELAPDNLSNLLNVENLHSGTSRSFKARIISSLSLKTKRLFPMIW